MSGTLTSELADEIRLAWAQYRPRLAAESRDRLVRASAVLIVAGMAAAEAAKRLERWGQR